MEGIPTLIGSHHSQQKKKKSAVHKHQRNTGNTKALPNHTSLWPFPDYHAIYSSTFNGWPPSPDTGAHGQQQHSAFSVTSPTQQGFANQPLLLTALSKLHPSPPRTGHEDRNTTQLTSPLLRKESRGFT